MAGAGDVDRGAGQGFTVGGGGAEGEERQGNEFTELELQNWVSHPVILCEKEGGKITPSSPPPSKVGVVGVVMGGCDVIQRVQKQGLLLVSIKLMGVHG